jgi:hypothetical protein
MEKKRFESLCTAAKGGQNAFIMNSSTKETGRIVSCSTAHIVVQTKDGQRHSWDYRGCEDVIQK